MAITKIHPSTISSTGATDGQLLSFSTVNGVAFVDNTNYVQLVRKGELSAVTGNARWYAPSAISISNVVARVSTAPVGAALSVDIKRNGVSNNIVTIADGGSEASNVTTITANEGDYFTIDVLSVGSNTAGSDLHVIMKYT
jgi:hypothetical protein